MCIDMGTVAAAAGAGTNVLSGRWIETSKYWRRVARIGLSGSADITDFTGGIVLKYGEREVARLFPATFGAAVVDDDDMMVISSKKLCPPNTPISLTLPANVDTNTLYWVIETQEFVQRGRRFGRGAAGCGVFQKATTTAQAVDASLLAGESYAVSDRDRKLVRIALAGGAGVNDSAIDVSFGSEQVMHIINLSATASIDKLKWLWHTSQLVLPANVPLNVRVSDAFPANNMILAMDLREA